MLEEAKTGQQPIDWSVYWQNIGEIWGKKWRKGHYCLFNFWVFCGGGGEWDWF